MTLHAQPPSRGIGGLLTNAAYAAHRRFGWKSTAIFVASAWSIGLPMVVAGPFVFYRFANLTLGQTLLLLIRFGITWAVCAVGVTVCATVLTRPVGVFERDQNPTTAANAREAIVRLPARFALCALPIAVVPGVVGGLWAVSTVVTLHIALVVIGAVATTAGTSAMIATAVAALPAVSRPMLDEIAPLAAADHTGGGISLRRLLPVMVPTIGVMTAVAGAAFSIQPGDDRVEALAQLSVAAFIAALVGIPASVILSRVLLESVDDLLAAAERIKAGQYDAPIPTQTTHEFDVVARSLNQAMHGLTERAALAAERANLLAEVTESRDRIIAASDHERNRIERNIHDGAQQRLVAIVLKLRVLMQQVTDPAQQARIGAVIDDVSAALDELRALARGLHPPVLETDGLGPALNQLFAHSGLEARVAAPAERFAPEVEATAYYVATEAFTNTIRYADASRFEFVVAQRDGHLAIEASDNGVGGADLRKGSGLRGLRDRLAAVGGTLRLESEPGAGTRLLAEIPLAAQ